MDLNMIKGLGRSYQQTLSKSKIFDVETLLRILPYSLNYLSLDDINTISNDKNITIYVTIISNIIEEDELLKFEVKSNDKVVSCEIENSHMLKRKLLTGKNYHFNGFYSLTSNNLNVENIFSIEDVLYDIKYEITDIASSLVSNFIDKGMKVLNNFNNELPNYIKTKKNYSDYKDILNKIHFPKSNEEFNLGLNLYVYEIFFNFFVKYYYYILTSSQKRIEEEYDLKRISMVINDYSKDFTDDIKYKMNFILKEYKKTNYTNLILEKYSLNEKYIITLILLVAKISTKKQVVIVTNENFDFYANMKNSLQKYNVKTEIMTKKGKNKENFSEFNSGKCDLVITKNVNFETLNKKNIGLIIFDNEKLNLDDRYKIDCFNTDTLFFTDTSFSNNLNKDVFKNLTIISEENCTYSESIYTNLMNDNNFKIIKEELNEKIVDILEDAASDAFDFVKNKKFTLCKENSDYFKKNINKGV